MINVPLDVLNVKPPPLKCVSLALKIEFKHLSVNVIKVSMKTKKPVPHVERNVKPVKKPTNV